MKNLIYFGAFVILSLSCRKESIVTTPSQDQDTSPLWVKFSELDHTINTHTILNPQPTDIRTYTDGRRIEYDFYIDGPIYPWLQVEVADYYTEDQRGTDTIYSVHLYIHGEALTENQKDGFVTTFKNSGLVSLPQFDSTFQLSYDSPINSPFSDTLNAEVFDGPDTRFLSPEDTIDLKDTTLQWSNEADDNNILSHFLNIGFYAHRNHLFQLEGDDPGWHALHYDFHEGIMGKGKKIFLFRWLNSSERSNYYYGWMELSLTDNREFTIHKVVFQID